MLFVSYSYNHLLVYSNLVNIKTYVSDDGKLHFVDSEGADTELPFSSGFTKATPVYLANQQNGTGTSSPSYTVKKKSKVLVISSSETVYSTNSTSISLNGSTVTYLYRASGAVGLAVALLDVEIGDVITASYYTGAYSGSLMVVLEIS